MSSLIETEFTVTYHNSVFNSGGRYAGVNPKDFTPSIGMIEEVYLKLKEALNKEQKYMPPFNHLHIKKSEFEHCSNHFAFYRITIQYSSHVGDEGA